MDIMQLHESLQHFRGLEDLMHRVNVLDSIFDGVLTSNYAERLHNALCECVCMGLTHGTHSRRREMFCHIANDGHES
jgi:hypothetical protein